MYLKATSSLFLLPGVIFLSYNYDYVKLFDPLNNKKHRIGRPQNAGRFLLWSLYNKNIYITYWKPNGRRRISATIL